MNRITFFPFALAIVHTGTHYVLCHADGSQVIAGFLTFEEANQAALGENVASLPQSDYYPGWLSCHSEIAYRVSNEI